MGGVFNEEFEQALIISVEFNSRKPNINDWCADVCWLSIKYV